MERKSLDWREKINWKVHPIEGKIDARIPFGLRVVVQPTCSGRPDKGFKQLHERQASRAS